MIHRIRQKSNFLIYENYSFDICDFYIIFQWERNRRKNKKLKYILDIRGTATGKTDYLRDKLGRPTDWHNADPQQSSYELQQLFS